MKNYFTLFNNLMEKYFSDGQALETVKDENQELLRLIKQAHKEWQAALNNFNYCYEDDMIDFSIYNIEAAEKKYVCLLKRARQEKITADGLFTN